MQANIPLRIGDDVVISIEDIDVIKQMQANHGGWNDAMKECLVGPCKLIQRIGVDAVVQAPSRKSYRLHSELLSKYNKPARSILPTAVRNADRNSSSSTISVGSRVTLTRDASWMKGLQIGHGGWSELMRLLLGQEVEVTEVFDDGDLYVTWSGTFWRINPLCIGEPKCEQFQKGNLVLISNDVEVTKVMQHSHGGWTEEMKAFAGKTGRVKRVLISGDVQVKIGDVSICYNPLVLTKISDAESLSRYSVGDIVEVINDKNRVKVLQEGHGGWNELMTRILQKKGTVKLIHPNGDLQVGMKDTEIRLNPECVVKAKSDDDDPFFIEMMSLILDDDTVSHSGDTPLHIAVRNKNYRLCCQLVEEGAHVNALNEKGMTPMMLAAQIGIGDVLSLLAQHPGARLDIEDVHNDTALHLAVKNSNDDAVRILLEAGANIKAINNKQFTPFHLAAQCGHEKILKLCLDKYGGSLVDLQKDDKFAALHLAAINNKTACLRLLIRHKADLNIRNNNMQTALHLAVSQKYMDCVKILVESEAEVDLLDKNRHTPLHEAILLHNMDRMKEEISGMFGLSGMLKLMEGLQSLSHEPDDIAMYLVEHGASLDILNCAGKSPLTACEDRALREKLRKMQTDGGQAAPPSRSRDEEIEEMRLKIQRLENEKLCTICCENYINVTLGCGHRMCEACANKVNTCPICRKKIDKKIRNF